MAAEIFKSLENRIVTESDSLALREEKYAVTFNTKRYLARALLTLTIVPTLLITILSHLVNFRVVYVLIFIGLYFSALIYFTETEFDWLVKQVARLEAHVLDHDGA